MNDFVWNFHDSAMYKWGIHEKLNQIWCQNLNETATQINVDNSITHCVFTIQLCSSYTSPWQPHHYIGILKMKKIKYDREILAINIKLILLFQNFNRNQRLPRYWLWLKWTLFFTSFPLALQFLEICVVVVWMWEADL